jgi:hypothetical protein
MIAMISGLRLIAIYYLELDRQTWHGRSKRTYLDTWFQDERQIMNSLAGWFDIQDKKKAAGCAGPDPREVWRGSCNNVSAEWVRMDFLTRFGI